MIEKSINDIGREDIDALVTNKVYEGRTLDYKRDKPGNRDEDKRELARDVSSFANAGGGDLIFGIEEAKDASGRNLGYAEKAVGIDDNIDQFKQWLEAVIRDNVDPRIQGIAIHKVDGFERGPVVVVRIPQSWNAPHMVTSGNKTQFYSRNSAGKQPLDVREIKAAFLAANDVGDKIRRFRDERIGRIVAGETPVPLSTDWPVRVVCLLVPVIRSTELSIDLHSMEAGDGSRTMPPLEYSNSWNSRFSLDGFVTYCGGGNEGPQGSYSLMFRNGAYEGVTTFPIIAKTTPGFVYGLPMEAMIVRAVARYFRVVASSLGGIPVSANVALIGVRGVRLCAEDPNYPLFKTHIAIDRDVLVLPDVLLENGDDIPGALRPIFDAMWQSSGWPGSCGYDSQGKWLAERHR